MKKKKAEHFFPLLVDFKDLRLKKFSFDQRKNVVYKRMWISVDPDEKHIKVKVIKLKNKRLEEVKSDWNMIFQMEVNSLKVNFYHKSTNSKVNLFVTKM